MAEKKQPEVLKLGDDLIAVIREIVQLSLLTGTNVVDHMRGIRAEIVGGQVVPTEQYVESYNKYVEDLTKEAEKMQAAMQAAEATDVEGDDAN
jgi:hypothetical protein